MATETNTPKTGTIAFVTAMSLILLTLSVAVLEGLFSIWQARAEEKASTSDLPTELDVYKKQQASRLTDIDAFKKTVIADAKAGKNLAAPPPPPSKPAAATDKQGDAQKPPPGNDLSTPGKTEPPKPPDKTPDKAPEKKPG